MSHGSMSWIVRSCDLAAILLAKLGFRPRTTLGGRCVGWRSSSSVSLGCLDRRIAAVTEQLRDAADASGTTLTTLYGVAAVAGVASIEAYSGDVVRHRLLPAADRQLNHALHVIAITHIRRHTPGKAYYQAKRPAGKSQRSVAMPQPALGDWCRSGSSGVSTVVSSSLCSRAAARAVAGGWSPRDGLGAVSGGFGFADCSASDGQAGLTAQPLRV